jgi:hypothetical protein
METPILLDAVGVPLRPGQRVLYCSVGIFAICALQWGTVIRAYIPAGGGERIQIRRDDSKHIVLRWSRRVVVMQQPQDTEAEMWLRRQLAKLGT